VANRSNTSPSSQQEFENVVLPRLKSELEPLQKQEQQARTEQAQAEQHLRNEQVELEDTLAPRIENAARRIDDRLEPGLDARSDFLAGTHR
jgi:hypothetical protein